MTMIFLPIFTWSFERINQGIKTKAKSVRMLMKLAYVQNPVMSMQFPSTNCQGCGTWHWKPITKKLETIQRQVNAPTHDIMVLCNRTGVRLSK